jgi:hypothetical protein
VTASGLQANHLAGMTWLHKRLWRPLSARQPARLLLLRDEFIVGEGRGREGRLHDERLLELEDALRVREGELVGLVVTEEPRRGDAGERERDRGLTVPLLFSFLSWDVLG